MFLLAGAVLSVSFIGGSDAASHIGGEGHGEGIDAVYSWNSDQPLGLMTVTLASTPIDYFDILVISPDDDQSIRYIEPQRVTHVDLKPLAIGTHTVLVLIDATSQLVAECELKVGNTVSLTYSASGGSGYMPPAEVEYGTSVKLAECTFVPPAGKQFSYWNVNGETKYPGQEVVVNKATVAEAVWKDRLCIITFSSGGGTGAMPSQTAMSGTQFTLPQCTFIPPGDGTFDGWDVNGERHDIGDVVTIIDDTTITARWSTPGDGGMTLILIGGGIALAAAIGIIVFLVLRTRKKNE